MKKNIFPRIGVITKNVINGFWAGAKVFKVDAILSIVSLLSIIYWAIDDTVHLGGAAGILFVYAFANVFRLSGFRYEINEFKNSKDSAK